IAPFFKPFIVQRVFVFLIRQDLPPAVTLLPVIFVPLELAGNLIVTVTFTFPLLTLEEETFETDGFAGFATLIAACALGEIMRLSTTARIRLSWGNFFMYSVSQCCQ
ncbi:MAG: hypothetical protein QNM01_06000, partial [Actinomycetes bacterium]